MEENQNVTAAEEKPSLGARIGANIKERFRKFMVKLKLRPMNIAFFVLIVSTIVYLLLLSSFSQAGLEYHDTGVPISIFVNTLFSILVLMLFLNSFPKRAKKPNLVMLILLFVFMAVLIGLDIFLYVKWNAAWTDAIENVFPNMSNGDLQRAEREKYIYKAMYGIIAHAAIVGVAAILTATYPLYGKLLRKVNTKKDIGESNLSEDIDTSAEV